MGPVHIDPEEHSVAERKWPCGYSNLPTPWELLASATQVASAICPYCSLLGFSGGSLDKGLEGIGWVSLLLDHPAALPV